jgi:hypothetical protein
MGLSSKKCPTRIFTSSAFTAAATKQQEQLVAALSCYKRGKRGELVGTTTNTPVVARNGDLASTRENTFGNVKQVGRLRSVVPIAHWSSLALHYDE